MTIQEQRAGSGRRIAERRKNNSIINGYAEYSGPERRSGQDRREIVDRRR